MKPNETEFKVTLIGGVWHVSRRFKTDKAEIVHFWTFDEHHPDDVYVDYTKEKNNDKKETN